MNNKGVTFDPVELAQVDRYICKGEAEEVWRPWFSYYGFQYVFVEGIRPDQATSSLLTYQVEHAAVAERGRFACSDEILNQLQEMTRRSALANLFFFPTDCPQREKHGWTDANQQAELYLLNFSAEKNYREWMNNIRKSQDETGMLPSIVPTSDCWGMGLGGLYWDAVVVNVPWAIWKYRGELGLLPGKRHDGLPVPALSEPEAGRAGASELRHRGLVPGGEGGAPGFPGPGDAGGYHHCL